MGKEGFISCSFCKNSIERCFISFNGFSWFTVDSSFYNGRHFNMTNVSILRRKNAPVSMFLGMRNKGENAFEIQKG